MHSPVFSLLDSPLLNPLVSPLVNPPANLQYSPHLCLLGSPLCSLQRSLAGSLPCNPQGNQLASHPSSPAHSLLCSQQGSLLGSLRANQQHSLRLNPLASQRVSQRVQQVSPLPGPRGNPRASLLYNPRTQRDNHRANRLRSPRARQLGNPRPSHLRATSAILQKNGSSTTRKETTAGVSMKPHRLASSSNFGQWIGPKKRPFPTPGVALLPRDWTFHLRSTFRRSIFGKALPPTPANRAATVFAQRILKTGTGATIRQSQMKLFTHSCTNMT